MTPAERAGLVSVVVPAYNSASVLGPALRSVLAQDYEPLEVLVIDDGSTDDTRGVVAAFSDSRLRYARRDNSGGPAGPRNEGLRLAQGEFVALCDSDDTIEPGVLSAGVAALRSDERLAMAFTDFVRVDEAGRIIEDRGRQRFPGFQQLLDKPAAPGVFRIPAVQAYGCLIEENFIRTTGSLLRAEVLRQVGPFDETLQNGDDKDMWLRITRRFDVVYLDRIGFRYRDRPGSISRRGPVLARSRIRVLEKQLQEGDPAPELVTRIQRQIARNLVALAYERQSAGEMREARRYYRQSLARHVHWPAIRGWLTCLAGRRLYEALRRSKR